MCNFFQFLVKKNLFFRHEDEIYPLLGHTEIRYLVVPRREEREAVTGAAQGSGSTHSSRMFVLERKSEDVTF